MDKEQKQEAVKEIGERLSSANAVFAVDYRGISVPQAAELRGKLREADASFSVVKNRLAKRITADSGASSLDEHLVGPTALAYVKGDAVIAAKAINDFTKEHQILAYKGGIMEGEVLDPEQFGAIARLPGLEVLHGQLVGLAASPLTGLVSGLNGLIQGLATQLGQISEQGLVGGDAPAEEAAEEEPAAGEPAEAEASGDEEPATEADASAGDDEEQDAPTDEPAGSDEPAADAEPQTEGEDNTEETSKSDDDADGEQTDEPDTESKED